MIPVRRDEVSPRPAGTDLLLLLLLSLFQVGAK